MRISLFSLVTIVFLAGSAVAKLCPEGDLNGNCRVDWKDIEVFAGQWLDNGDCEDVVCADFDGLNGINLVDFSILANSWFNRGIALVINEFMASNNSDSNIADPQGDYDDWIEIYNFGDVNIDLAGMYLSDKPYNPTKWQVPSGYSSQTTVPAHGFVVIWADGEPEEGPLHADFKISADGEDILLSDANETLIDSISFGPQTANISYERYPDGADNWQFSTNPTPGANNTPGYIGEVNEIEFSHTRGFYDTPFNVTMACTTPGATIYYTTDGSDPVSDEVNSPQSISYTVPVAVSATKCVRASAIKTGWRPSPSMSHTYIFINDVITQSPNREAPGAGWPTSNINGQYIDYGMDPQVVEDLSYSDLMDDALLSIPTLSIVTNLENLFDSAEGIYVNAYQDGRGWERPASMELINPDGSDGFHINMGLRIRGGWSRSGSNPKHAFRLFFRGEYGDAKLRFPLFGDEGVEEFDKMDLRTSQNYSWSFGHDARTTMNKEVFSRDLQRDMGQPYTRSRYYHLYINGQYWGIFQTQERSEARYAESYFGGDKDNYDVIKVEAGLYEIGYTDGNLAAYERLWNAAVAGFASDNDYYHIQGLNTDGTPNPAYERLLDVNNVIDYEITRCYVGGGDAPLTGTRVNNLWGIYNRVNPDGWKFFAHDFEHTIFNEDETGHTDVGDQFKYFNPVWLHQKLTAHPEYLMLFADHVHRYFFNGGALTTDIATARYMNRANTIELAIIAESARWGDSTENYGTIGSDSTIPRTKDDDWIPAINDKLNNFFLHRTATVINQFKNRGWYPNVEAPSFDQHGGEVPQGYNLTISGSGTIYYTIDGNDPRLAGGSVSGSAITYSGPVTLNESRCVKARAKSGSTWSALNEAVFAVGAVVNDLRITEIMYHPQDTNEPNDPNEEFIELKNIGPNTLNVNLVSFTKGIHFTFGWLELEPNEYIVVVKEQTAFEAEYGTEPNTAGEYTGKLDNAGERIRLQDAIGRTILEFEYKDGWRAITDGGGFSLTIIDPNNSDPNSWGEKDAWRASAYLGGSPGQDDTGIIPNPGAVVINEALAHSHLSPDWIELYNSTAGDVNIGGWFLSDNDDDDANLKKYKIADGTLIPAGGYLVFYEDVNFGQGSSDPGSYIPFAFSENGEVACLSSAEGGVLTGYREIEDFGASEDGVAFGRYYKASTGNFNFVPMDSNTPGSANAYPKVGPIVINEIMYHPDWPEGGAYDNDEYEYVELYNISDSAVTLYDAVKAEPWKFTDGVNYTFPASPAVTIPAGGYLLVVENPTAFSWRYPGVPSAKILGPWSGRLSNSGEKVQLSMPGDVDEFSTRYYIRIDRVNYSDGSHPEDCPGGVDLWPIEADGDGNSLTRIDPNSYGNDPNNWAPASPTPGG